MRYFVVLNLVPKSNNGTFVNIKNRKDGPSKCGIKSSIQELNVKKIHFLIQQILKVNPSELLELE